MQCYMFTDNLRGQLLERVLRGIAPLCTEMLVVVRSDEELRDGGRALLARLEPHRRRTTETSVWPGTRLFGQTATAHVYSCSEPVLSEVWSDDRGLYDWRQPKWPEDPCFLRADGTAVLTTVSHEETAYVELGPDEASTLLSAIPELSDVLAPESDGA